MASYDAWSVCVRVWVCVHVCVLSGSTNSERAEGKEEGRVLRFTASPAFQRAASTSLKKLVPEPFCF